MFHLYTVESVAAKVIKGSTVAGAVADRGLCNARATEGNDVLGPQPMTYTEINGSDVISESHHELACDMTIAI